MWVLQFAINTVSLVTSMSPISRLGQMVGTKCGRQGSLTRDQLSTNQQEVPATHMTNRCITYCSLTKPTSLSSLQAPV